MLKFLLIGISVLIISDVDIYVRSTDTQCPTPPEPNSPVCNGQGTLQCGICSCNAHYFGLRCECNAEPIVGNCIPDDANDDTTVCSGHGSCVCGRCICHQRRNPEETNYGQFCECDNYSCPRHNGLICSGPSHGTCDCGTCTCLSGYKGIVCQLPE